MAWNQSLFFLFFFLRLISGETLTLLHSDSVNHLLDSHSSYAQTKLLIHITLLLDYFVNLQPEEQAAVWIILCTVSSQTRGVHLHLKNTFPCINILTVKSSFNDTGCDYGVFWTLKTVFVKGKLKWCDQSEMFKTDHEKKNAFNKWIKYFVVR